MKRIYESCGVREDTGQEYYRQIAYAEDEHRYRDGLWVVAYRDFPTWNLGVFETHPSGEAKIAKTLKLAPHHQPALHAFVAGSMPTPVFADYLEDHGVELPTVAFRLLRGWMGDQS